MTYQELLQKLRKCTKEELEQEVIICMEADGVFYAAEELLDYPVEGTNETQMCISIPSGGN